jgi:multiple antibiotic resistance protein
MLIEYFKTAFATLFVAVDPPGLAAIFLALTIQMTVADRKATARRAVVIAFCILLAVALGGKAVLEMLGISMPAFRIAGGLLLFYIGAEMVFERREQRKNNSAESTMAYDHPRNIAAFPLAIPLMAGPGAITATILQASAAQGSWLAMIGLIVIIAVVTGSCLLVFLLAGHIDRFLGMTGRVVLSRLLGLLLAALAIQNIGDGILQFWQMK